MGLIKAFKESVSSTFADQWKEYFYCDDMGSEYLVKRGYRRTSAKSSNNGNDNVITNGSIISVGPEQFMIITEQGKIVDYCGEPGEYKFDTSTEPSLFSGNLGESILETFKTIGTRFTFGGTIAKEQRVYFVNTREIMNNLFGTPTPIPFRVVDNKINLDIDTAIRCSGTYTYRISDPLLFYNNIASGVSGDYKKTQLDSQIKSEFIAALQPAIGCLSDKEIRPSQFTKYTGDIAKALNNELSESWSKDRGLCVVRVDFTSVSVPPEDAELIKNAQHAGMLRDPGMAGAALVGAQAEAMKAAASNSAGAMTGFMGMGMATNMGGMNAQDFFKLDQQNKAAQAQAQAAQAQAQPAANSWKCSCGAVVTGKFCTECGSPRPVENSWTCSCGAVNKGKFCPECGAKKPAGIPQYKCDKCGWEPEKGARPPKFCPECGDPFDDGDIIE